METGDTEIFPGVTESENVRWKNSTDADWRRSGGECWSMTAGLLRRPAAMMMRMMRLQLLATTQTGRRCCSHVVVVVVVPSSAEQQTPGLYDLHNQQFLLCSRLPTCLVHPSVPHSVPYGLLTRKLKLMITQNWCERFPRPEWPVCQFSVQKVKDQTYRTSKTAWKCRISYANMACVVAV